MKSLSRTLFRPSRGQNKQNIPKSDVERRCDPTHSGSYVSCPYNPCLTFGFELALDTHTALFHHQCIDCRPLIPESETLCPSCQHLNLRHLLLCVPRRKWFYIILGTIAEISSRPECPLCRVIARMIQRNRKQAEEEWEVAISDDNECILGQAHTSESSHGSLYFQIFFFGREALEKHRRFNIPRYYLQLRFQDLQIQIPAGWDPDKTVQRIITSP